MACVRRTMEQIRRMKPRVDGAKIELDYGKPTSAGT